MRAFIVPTPFKVLVFSTLLALFLMAMLWGLMQLAAGNPFGAMAANGEVRFVNQQEGALANQEIRLLCFQGVLDTNPTDMQFVSAADGTMPVALSAGCTHIAALHLWHVQPTSKPGHGPAYWVYTTSWKPGSSDLTAIAASNTTTVTIPDTQTLVLFNVVAGLAWEPAKGSDYVSDLLKGLGASSVVSDGASASSYLYDLTNGTMAIGPVTIHTNGESWESNDIRILPANDLKPSAQVGGIVEHSFKYTSTVFVTATTVYSPGAIIMGRNWAACAPASAFSSSFGYLDECTFADNVTDTIKLYGATDAILYGPFTLKYGNWHDAPGFRTIVHEWAHYALFLYDEYQTVQAQPAECTRAENKLIATDSDNASAMDWHYTASELWETMPPPASCAKSKQYLFHGLSDCETLAVWYEIQQIPNAKDLPPLGCNAGEPGKGPSTLGLTKFLFDRDPPELEPTPTPSPTKPPPARLHYLPYLQRSPSRKEAETPKEPAKQAAAAAAIIDARVAVNALAAKGQVRSIPSIVHGYQLRPDGGDSFEQIWYQGKVISDSVTDTNNGILWNGHITILGAQDEFDRVKIFGESYTTDLPTRGGRWFGEAAVTSGALVNLQPYDWLASMDLEYESNDLGQVVTVTAHVTLPVGGSSPPQIAAGIQICSPDHKILCYWDQKLNLISATATQQYWRGSVSPGKGEPVLPNYGIVRLHVSYSGSPGQLPVERELISWYKTSGVGPASYNAHAPTPPGEDDTVTLFSETVRRHCNQLIFSAATNAEMLTRSLGTDGGGRPFVGLLGQPVDIAVRLPLAEGEAQCPERFGLGSRKIAQKDIYLTLSYNQLYAILGQDTSRDYLTPALEKELQILFFDPDTGWQVVAPPATARNTTMNWISIPFTQDGIYAIGLLKP